MIKYIIVLFNLLPLLFFNAVEEDVKVNHNFPSEAKPGEEFIVEITIQKGTVTGFAKLQQDLPDGFSAEALENAGASFTFSDQKIKYIWMQLPEKEDVTISYKVQIAEDVSSGEKKVETKFSYLEENQKKDVTPADHAVNVLSAEEVAAAEAPEPESYAEVDRKITHLGNNEFIALITIKKSAISGFAKVQEVLPEGLSAKSEETKEAVFSFVDKKAKFVWMNIPEEDEFTISYVITVEDEEAVEKLDNITGEFSYLEDSETKKIGIETVGPVPGKEALAEEVEEVEEEEIPEEEEEEIAEEVVPEEEEEEVEEVVETVEEEKPEEEEEEEVEIAEGEAKTTKVPMPETGVLYRVQVCAGHKPVDDLHFKRVYQYDGTIFTETHEGWLKYTVGKYEVYKSARDERVRLRAGYTFPGPFVSAYSEGERVTVQEALMITNQKWIP